MIPIFLFLICALILLPLISAEFFEGRDITILQSTKRLIYTVDHQYIITATTSSLSLFWGVNGTHIKDIELQNKQQITAISVSQSLVAAIGFNNGDIQLVELIQDEDKVYVGIEGTDNSKVTSVCFTNDGLHIAYGNQNGYVYVTQIETGQIIGQINLQNGTSITTVSCEYQNSTIQDQSMFVAGAGSQSQSVFVLFQIDGSQSSNFTQLHRFESHQYPITSSTFSPDGSHIYATNSNGEIYKYDTLTYQQKNIFFDSNDALYDILVSENNEIILTINSTHVIVAYPDENTFSIYVQVYPSKGKVIGMVPSAANIIFKQNDNKAKIMGYCKQGSYLDGSAMNCSPCKKQCKLCLDEDDRCFECSSSYFLDQFTCKFCGIGCLQCSSVNNCIKCDTDNHFMKNLTTKQCQCVESYYLQDDKCKSCSEALTGCQLCESKDICIKCDEAKHRILYQHHCLCDKGFFENQGLCQSCTDKMRHCLECDNGQRCNKCDQSRHWVIKSQKNGCICEKGYQQFDDQCIKCPIGCIQCNKQKQCLKCDASQNFSPQPIDGECTCKPKYYFYEQFQKCEPCMPGCLNCTDSNICIICDSSSHFVRNQDTLKCQCESSYYFSNKACLACNKTLQYCQQCDSDRNCSKCQGQLVNIEGKCTCGAGKFVTNNKNCQNCENGCYQCTNQTQCITCDIQHHFVRNLTNFKCECAILYYLADDLTCKLCRQSINYCIQCQSASYCQICDSDLNRISISGKCKCMEGYYENENNLCLPCDIQNCKKCIDQSICTQCDQGYQIVEGVCRQIEHINIWIILGPCIGAVLCICLGVALMIRRKRRIKRQSLLSQIQGPGEDSLIVNPP